ncbi:MAG: 3-phosphoshikimate 1-carboxyvinyltransferase [Phycisphaeraceae bacterium]|nr:3-phosphoshikimate 1-carboxyvinyltransferase [Phycisphaeraceae bacterium]
MKLICSKSTLRGAVDIPASKSHTIRAVAIAALAQGQSVIRDPLESADAQAAVDAYRALGATIECAKTEWHVRGFAGKPTAPANIIDVLNSGTTLRLALGSAALLSQGQAQFTGDHQIRRRPIGPLAQSLTDLGATAVCTLGNGCAPVVISPKLRGGRTSIQAVTSQYLSSLLINCPLAEGDTEIDVPLLNEAPYVLLTLDWLNRQGIQYQREELRKFRIPGRQHYKGFDLRVPADFSSATFFLAAGALGDNDILVRGLDMTDSQGDKKVIDYLRQMGAKIELAAQGVRVQPGQLHGCDIDFNETPDALPMFAVLGCFAAGTTRLLNVPQARLKETDRIAVMAQELKKMGGKLEELPDGLVIHQSDLRPAAVDGHDDHRVVMALAVAASALAGKGDTSIATAEAMNVTFPTFADCLRQLGGKAEIQG